MIVSYKENDAGQLVLAFDEDLTIDDMKNPKKGKILTESFVKEVLAVGTGFKGGKERIREIIRSDRASAEKRRLIKAEYGIGGSCWGNIYKDKSGEWKDGKYPVGYSTIKSKLTIDFIENKEKYSCTYSWGAIEKLLEKMINEKEY